MIQRPAVGGIAADGLRSSRWTLTPPAAGAELAAPAIMPGSNAARAMSESKRGRSDLWRLCSAWPDDGAAAMSAADAAACVPGGMHPTTARRMLAAALADGLVFVAPAPPGNAGRGRPAALYAWAPAARAALAAGDAAALAALLPQDRQGRADAVAASITAERRRKDDAFAQGGAAGVWRRIYIRAEIDRNRRRTAIDAARNRAAAAAAAAAATAGDAAALEAVAALAATMQPAADDVAASGAAPRVG